MAVIPLWPRLGVLRPSVNLRSSLRSHNLHRSVHCATDLTGKNYVDAGRKVYLNNPTSDINPLPMMFFVTGKRVRRTAEQAIVHSAGAAIGIEDTWIPYFCIATDLSAAEQAILTRGFLSRALLASFSISGALPPVVINGNLMVDGGAINNFPLDHLKPVAKRKCRLPFLPETLLRATISWPLNRQRCSVGSVKWGTKRSATTADIRRLSVSVFLTIRRILCPCACGRPWHP